MRILAIKRRVPRSHRSGQDLPARQVLTRLAEKHDVTLASWEGEAAPDLPMRTIVRPLPPAADTSSHGLIERRLIAHYGLHAGSIRWLHDLIDEYQPDAVFGIDYQTLLPLDGNPQRPRVCSLVDNRLLDAWQGLRQHRGPRWRGLKEVAWSFLLHRRFARAADVFTFVTEREAAGFRRFTNRPCLGIPNGVDTEHFQPNGTPRGDAAVVFVGSLNFDPNIRAIAWFCEQVWPRVRQARPNATLTLVGKQPVPRVLALDGHEGIRVAADVPDVRPYLAEAAVEVVPMRSGGGIKNKILEGWAMGTPIVATRMSLPGTAARPGDNILVADQPDAFAAHVVRCLRDAAWRVRIGHNARQTAVAKHSWEQTASRVEECLRTVHATARRP